MALVFRPVTDEMIAVQDLSYPNQTSANAPAAAAGKAADAATERLSQGTDVIGPAVQVYDLDGQAVIMPRVPLGNVPNRAGQMVPPEELEAMGEEFIRQPQCDVPGCRNESQFSKRSSSGRPLSVNRRHEIVLGDLKPIHVEGMTRNQRARAQAGLKDVIGPSGADVRPAVLSEKSVVFLCLDHQYIPFAPDSKPAPKRYVSGPYSGLFQASARADIVAGRTGRAPTVDSVKLDGTELFYVIGDDGSDGYAGTLVQR